MRKGRGRKLKFKFWNQLEQQFLREVPITSLAADSKSNVIRKSDCLS